MSTHPADDPARTIEQIVRGDQGAFDRLYDRYASLVFTFAVRLLGSRTDAEDLLQEVFIRVWRKAATYRPELGNPEAWLMTITRNRARDRRREQAMTRKAEAGHLGPPAAPEPGSWAERDDEVRKARQTLAQLPEDHRIVLEMAYLDGLTQTEIADRLGKPLGTVKTRMRSGLARLRGLVHAGDAEGPA
jgi:RNA polymerase sigma-70 factor, ECF subfamily